MGDILITTKEAALQLNINRRQVNNLLRDGKLRGERFTARFWGVYQNSVDTLAVERIAAKPTRDRQSGSGE